MTSPRQKELAGKYYLIADLYRHGYQATLEPRQHRRGTIVRVNEQTTITVLTKFVKRDELGQEEYLLSDGHPPKHETELYAFVRVFPEEQGGFCHEVYIAPSDQIIQLSIQHYADTVLDHLDWDWEPTRKPYMISLADLQPVRNNWAALHPEAEDDEG
jgi:hypothetical protein